MSSRLVRFGFTPGENEQIEAIIKVPEEKRSVIHGIVKDHKNKVVEDAVVKLFVVCDGRLKPITHTFTDDCGQFLFGPLEPCKHYAIKIWINNIKIKEIVIHPDECYKDKDDCHKDDDCHKHDDCHKDDDCHKHDDCHKDDDCRKHDDCHKEDDCRKHDDCHKNDDCHKRHDDECDEKRHCCSEFIINSIKDDDDE